MPNSSPFIIIKKYYKSILTFTILVFGIGTTYGLLQYRVFLLGDNQIKLQSNIESNLVDSRRMAAQLADRLDTISKHQTDNMDVIVRNQASNFSELKEKLGILTGKVDLLVEHANRVETKVDEANKNNIAVNN